MLEVGTKAPEFTLPDKDGNPVSPLYTWQDGRGNLPDYEEAHSIGIPCW